MQISVVDCKRSAIAFSGLTKPGTIHYYRNLLLVCNDTKTVGQYKYSEV